MHNAKTTNLRAAQYVRMSTEHQQYSTENQSDKIRDYAASHDMEIVRTYADEGKSGLNIGGRDGLQRLLADVVAGNTDFEVILVYDVSRWGRFQDADESAHYEYLCKQAGIRVVYCAAQITTRQATRQRYSQRRHQASCLTKHASKNSGASQQTKWHGWNMKCRWFRAGSRL